MFHRIWNIEGSFFIPIQNNGKLLQKCIKYRILLSSSPETGRNVIKQDQENRILTSINKIIRHNECKTD